MPSFLIGACRGPGDLERLGSGLRPTDHPERCGCFTTDSLPRGYLGQLFELRRVQNSTVNARGSRFILVQALMIE
jgi:hypothetical protein